MQRVHTQTTNAQFQADSRPHPSTCIQPILSCKNKRENKTILRASVNKNLFFFYTVFQCSSIPRRRWWEREKEKKKPKRSVDSTAFASRIRASAVTINPEPLRIPLCNMGSNCPCEQQKNQNHEKAPKNTKLANSKHYKTRKEKEKKQ